MARRPAHRLLVVPQRRHALEKLVLHATSLRLPIVELEGGSLTALAGFDGHQGVALVVEPRRYATLEDILARAAERDEAPFVLALDSLEDPQNVGTLLRSAEAAGVHGVLFPTHRQAPLTPSAVKASAGAVEHLLLAPVDDLAQALTDLRSHGLRVAGAEADAPLTARQSDLRGPLVIVVGSEGQGLGPAVRRRADLFMRIPMRGAVGSLNAAVAGSILLFEAVAQRDPDGRGAPPQAVPPPEPETVDADERVDTAASLPLEQPPARSKPGQRSLKRAGAGSADVAEPAPPPTGDDELLPSDGARAAAGKVVRTAATKSKVKAAASATVTPRSKTAPKAAATSKMKAATAKPKAATKPKAKAATAKPKAATKPKAKAATAKPEAAAAPKPASRSKAATPRTKTAPKPTAAAAPKPASAAATPKAKARPTAATKAPAASKAPAKPRTTGAAKSVTGAKPASAKKTRATPRRPHA